MLKCKYIDGHPPNYVIFKSTVLKSITEFSPNYIQIQYNIFYLIEI